MARTEINPLAEGDRDHAFRLTFRAYPRLVDELDNPAPRIDLCVAAFLQNRAEDDGVRRFRGGAFAGNYAVSTALKGHIRQRYRVVDLCHHAAKIRLSDKVDAGSARQVAAALGVWHGNMDEKPLSRWRTRWRRFYTRIGVSTRLRQLDIPREDFQGIANETVKNFNANAGARSAGEQIEEAMALLEAAHRRAAWKVFDDARLPMAR